jgi:hypothetical protein
MKIEIRKKKNGKMAVLISFDTESEKFESASERNKFFAGLHGRKQTIKRGDRKYVYRRAGLLDEVPHIPIENSVFIVAMEHLKRMEKFFDSWEDKVRVQAFPVLLTEKNAEKLKGKKEREVKIE